MSRRVAAEITGKAVSFTVCVSVYSSCNCSTVAMRVQRVVRHGVQNASGEAQSISVLRKRSLVRSVITVKNET